MEHKGNLSYLLSYVMCQWSILYYHTLPIIFLILAAAILIELSGWVVVKIIVDVAINKVDMVVFSYDRVSFPTPTYHYYPHPLAIE